MNFPILKTPAPNQLEDPVKSRGSITISRSLEESIKIADAIIVLHPERKNDGEFTTALIYTV